MRVKAIFLLALAMLSSLVLAQDPSELVGKPAPALKVSKWLNTSGKALSLSSLKGKVVVLDFWAFW